MVGIRQAVQVLSMLLVMGAWGCEGSSESQSAETCDDDGQVYEVGEQWVCSDGCNSCVCLEGGAIATTYLECPQECGPEDCGPALGMPNYLCDDGETTAGPAGCDLQDDGNCGWTVIECPEPVDPCDDLDCSPCVNGECLDEDEVCEPGSVFDAGDGCNSCTCPESGLVAEAGCTEMACEQACGTQADCADNQFCDFTYDDCGIWLNTTMGGTCQIRPEGCVAGGPSPGVCSCDGSWGTNTCELQAAGSDYQKFGGCFDSDVGDSFICGTTTCAAASQVCAISMNDIVGDNEPEFYSSCSELPSDCAQGDCSCLQIDQWTECFDQSGFTMVIYPGG